MCKWRGAPKRQENGDAAQPRYRTSMNVTIRARSRRPSASDGIIADQTRKRCRREKRDYEYQKLHDSFVSNLILVRREEQAGETWDWKDSRLCQSFPKASTRLSQLARKNLAWWPAYLDRWR